MFTNEADNETRPTERRQSTSEQTLSRDDWPGLAVAIGFCELAGIVPGILTAEDIAVLTESEAEEPWFSPPGYVVPLVWNVLYPLMGIALYLVWRDNRRTAGGKVGLGLFVAQLGLNAAWSLVVFGSRATGARGYLLGFVMLLPLVFAVAATLLAFACINRKAALLLVPYLGWITFATVLNYHGWKLNR